MKKATIVLLAMMLLTAALIGCQRENQGAPKESLPQMLQPAGSSIPLPPESSPAVRPMIRG